jgi:glycolate dehydrogenase FAD-binding subunit
MNDLITEWAERIRDAAERRAPLQIRGGGSKDFYGGALRGEPLETGAYHGILDYEPTELVLSARSGTPLAAIEAALAQRHQMLPFEPPHFGNATLGGCIAAGLSGPRRAQAGSVRDFVLGVRILDGRGDDLAFGGRVIKNVAGYDVARLMTGAMGTLGVILDVSLKVLPSPQAERTQQLKMGQDEAIRAMNAWAARPLPISGTCHEGEVLSVRLSGAESAIAAAAASIGGERIDDGAAFWKALREQKSAFFGGDEPLWRVAVKPTAPALPLPGRQLLEWNGALRWIRTESEDALVRDVARKAGGHATLFRAVARADHVFHPLPEAMMQLHRRLKQTFDPNGILNPGRLYPEL